MRHVLLKKSAVRTKDERIEYCVVSYILAKEQRMNDCYTQRGLEMEQLVLVVIKYSLSLLEIQEENRACAFSFSQWNVLVFFFFTSRSQDRDAHRGT